MKSTAIITCTHNRPTPFKNLERYVAAQTFQDFDWFVVCDAGADNYKFKLKQKVIRREASEDDPMPSLCHNMLAGLEAVKGYERVALLEDDDWYHENYLFETMRHLDQTELMGWSSDAYYYVLNRKAKRMHNNAHASLACTAFKASALPWVKKCCERGQVFIDMLLWLGYEQDAKKIRFPGKKLLVSNFTGLPEWGLQQPKLDKSGFIINEHPRHVGLKENWHGEETGLSEFGHRAEGGMDVLGDVLKKWLGEEEAAQYLKYTVTPKPGAPFIIMPMPVEAI